VVNLALSFGVKEASISVSLDLVMTLLLESMVVNQIIDIVLFGNGSLGISDTGGEGHIHVLLVHILTLKYKLKSTL
jgi:hypothetical protein